MIQNDLEQDKAIHAKESQVLVCAGAGSGKTHVLTERVKYLLSEGVDPSSIVAITYTNMAAEEMTQRLASSVDTSKLFIGTVHSFANKILSNSGRAYHILTKEIDQLYHKQLIDHYCKHLTSDKYIKYDELREKQKFTTEVTKREVESYLTSDESYELSCLDATKPISAEFPWTVQMLLNYNNVITFDELIKLTTTYLKSNGILLDHVLVDEFQDIASLEYEFIKSLNANNYYFVGDDWQSIYGWKGGNVDIFISLSKNPEFTKYYLENNYRCSSAVLNYSNYVISEVYNKVKKSVVCKSGTVGEVVHGRTNDLSRYLMTIKTKGNYSDWFILVRTNRDLYKLQEKLTYSRIPYVTFKREGMSLAEMNSLVKGNTVKLLTTHVSKGLESPNVILYGSSFKLGRKNQKDEEVKVYYVGCTRAKDKLIILN